MGRRDVDTSQSVLQNSHSERNQCGKFILHQDKYRNCTKTDSNNRYCSRTDSDSNSTKTQSDSNYYTKTQSENNYYTKTYFAGKICTETYLTGLEGEIAGLGDTLVDLGLVTGGVGEFSLFSPVALG